MLKIKNIYKTKEEVLNDMTLKTDKITNYIKKYFGNSDYYVGQDNEKGWYNFEIKSKRYDSLIKIINDKYKVYLKDGYWYFDLVEKVE